jgi:Tol biopolymer transport system component
MASCDAAGVPGVGHCYFWRSRLSGDGRYCVFDTFASFSALDTNNTVDIYRKDLVTGQIVLVSADPTTGIASPGAYSYTPSISADGRYVAFATGSVFAANDTNGVGTSDVYVRDMNSNSMMLMSVGMSGVAETSGYSEISADGRHVAFASASNNIVPNDNNTTTDLFVRDWQLNQTTREMVSYSGGDPNHSVAACAIAANGRRLAFTAYASNIVAGDPNSINVDCYARDRGPSPLPVTYCIAKVNSQGCTPAIGFSGVPSASGANPFHITAANIVNQKVGTLFYSVAGPSQIPFQGGWLCVQSPRRVPGLVFSARNIPGPDCSGAFDRDFNAHIMSGVDPALVPGQEFWAQFWSRDPADPTTTNVTDALDAVVGP